MRLLCKDHSRIWMQERILVQSKIWSPWFTRDYQLMWNWEDIKKPPCPLKVWSKGNFGGDKLPMLSRTASIVFLLSPADVERRNSTTAKIYLHLDKIFYLMLWAQSYFLKEVIKRNSVFHFIDKKFGYQSLRNLLL